MGEDSSTRPLTLLYLGLSLRRSENRSIILSFLSPVPRTNFIVYHLDIIIYNIRAHCLSANTNLRRSRSFSRATLRVSRLFFSPVLLSVPATRGDHSSRSSPLIPDSSIPRSDAQIFQPFSL